jgi:hypothetical protein
MDELTAPLARRSATAKSNAVTGSLRSSGALGEEVSISNGRLSTATSP